jgi:hypothetical protein
MKVRAKIKWFLTGLAALMLAGCVTPQKIDWTARIGSYTYDQAITELGPPDKSARLSDGSMVAEWLQRPAEIIVTPTPYLGPPGFYWAPLPPVYAESRAPALYLRLTFGPGGRLERFKELTR